MAIRYRFLIDECLSQGLADVATSHGYEAAHVVHRKLTGRSDHVIAANCVDRDLVMVTNNARDYRAIYASLVLHPGLVIIVPSVVRARQIELFLLVLDRVTHERDLVNKLVEIDADGLITIVEWPNP